MLNCSVPGCKKNAQYGKTGLCSAHYERRRVYGDVNFIAKSSIFDTVEDRLLRRSVWRNDCLEWIGARDKDGYGITGFQRKYFKAHRLAYEAWIGPIPEGLVVRHKCDNPPCINPEHLEGGTVGDNNRDTLQRGRRIPLSGDQSPAHKVTDADAIRLRNEFLTTDVSFAELGRKYGISSAGARLIAYGKRVCFRGRGNIDD